MKLALSLLMLPVAVLAHPISQGSIDVEVTPGNLHVRARVPVEAVFLTGHATTLAETWSTDNTFCSISRSPPMDAILPAH
jgi:hypothetical protein